MRPQLLGHTEPGGRTEGLDEHSRAVADHAKRLAAKFDSGDFGFAAGLLHDLGKAKDEFQAYLRNKRGSEPHSAEGAKFAARYYSKSCPRPFAGPIGRLLGFPIAGHHAGLANGHAVGGGTLPLSERLETARAMEPWFDTNELPGFTAAPRPLLVAKLEPFGWAFFIRMLFSTLVDADFLETERWFNEANKLPIERSWQGELGQLKIALDQRLETFDASASELAALRAEVLRNCRAAASQRTGLFSLTVPTGGGKTLSSLAFALDHAIAHKLDRVIYVIPFTSIVEQTADVFGKALGDQDAILEHHSAFDDEKMRGSDSEDRNGAEKLRLAAQNWGRPVVVTTAVQFFESLFSNRTSRCRKLHNIARSVVVLDEAQTMPIKLLRPCLAALNELARGYRTSVVLCTATQPALTMEAGLKAPEALRDVREIIQPGRNLYGRLRRVRTVRAELLSDAQLIEALANVERGLVIVNNRRHARELFEALGKSGLAGACHLSTAMTAAHRQHVLADIRQELKDRKQVRLISTSLIEAGVDISFDAVWRAWAGLDQIAQAAGRCNREGELGELGGQLTIFQPEEREGRRPPPELRTNGETAKRVLANGLDPLSPEAVAAYFRELLWTKDDGGKLALLDNVKVGEDETLGIMKTIEDSAPQLNFRFADIAEAFRLIEDAMVPVIIPTSAHRIGGASDELIRQLRFAPTIGGLARKLQRHLVQVPRKDRGEMIGLRLVEVVREREFGQQFALLTDRERYDDVSGLKWRDLTARTPESNVM